MTVREEIEPALRERIVYLGRRLKARRMLKHVSLRDAEAETGIPFNTLCRLEAGEPPSLINMLAVLRWLDIPASWLTGEPDMADIDAYQRGWDERTASLRAFIDDTSTAAQLDADGEQVRA